MFSDLKLIAISDVERFGVEHTLAQARRLAARVKPGTLGIQLRDHREEARQRLALGRGLRAITAEYGQRLIVNDRLDLACILGADGLHLGEASVTIRDARRFFDLGAFGRSLSEGQVWVSRSLHVPVLPELLSERLGVGHGVETEELPLDRAPDAWLLSPVLQARKGREALGLEVVQLVRNQIDAGKAVRPRLFALGGVGPDDVQALLLAGADGVAAISEVWEPTGGDALPLLSALDMLA